MAVDDDGDPGVVALVLASDPGTLRCTGMLVADRVVLTAAHCDADRAVETLQVFFGPDLRRSGTLVSIIDVIAHPEADDTADADLALFLLAEPAPVAPIVLTATMSLADPPPVSVRLVGYGASAPDAADDVRKREGRSRTTEVTPQHVVLGADPSLPCNGDSGGPVYVTTPVGERLAAVVSRGDAACTERARATRLDAHLDAFIQPALDAWAPGSLLVGEPCLYDGHCVSGRCAPALDEPSLRFCASSCTGDADCEPPLSCQADLCRYPLPSPGAVGAACAAHADCARGDCLTGQGDLCSVRCVSGRGDCPASHSCEHLGGVDFYCLPDPAPGCDACAVRAGSAGPEFSFSLVLLLLAWVRARRR